MQLACLAAKVLLKLDLEQKNEEVLDMRSIWLQGLKLREIKRRVEEFAMQPCTKELLHKYICIHLKRTHPLSRGPATAASYGSLALLLFLCHDT